MSTYIMLIKYEGVRFNKSVKNLKIPKALKLNSR